MGPKTTIPPQVAPASVDVFRDTWVRYFGYANEVGEAFGPMIPKKGVTLSYLVAFGYVGADTVSKGMQSRDAGDSTAMTARKGADCFIWQSLASVLIPGKIINMVTHYSKTHLEKHRWKPLARFGPTSIGLCAIPFIIEPIDHMVDALMDNTFRKV